MNIQAQTKSEIEDRNPTYWDQLLKFKLWIAWFLLSLFMTCYYALALLSEDSSTKTALLPGETTHGHYQIEMKCNACHTPMMSVKQDVCLDCHQAELNRAKDTHPAKKFNDPTNAERLALIDAKNCITCHQEHVPQQTHEMGLTIPKDYCIYCHQDIEEQRPSHLGMDHKTCSTSGCHNYHDNTALYENFLLQHAEDADHKPTDLALVPQLDSKEKPKKSSALLLADQDAPKNINVTQQILTDWVDTAHALNGINCTDCHQSDQNSTWSDQVKHDHCGNCHEPQHSNFLESRHGMRLAQGLSPMTPKHARLPMNHDAFHKQLSCNSCHEGHRFDTKQAAVNACIKCHDDDHTQNYLQSKHYKLWADELSGNKVSGSGVSCATCHMPRVEIAGKITVDHNQNENLRPNEKMIRSSCIHCHGLQFSLDALADEQLIQANFHERPSTHIKSIEMVKAWFDEKEKKKQQRRNQQMND